MIKEDFNPLISVVIPTFNSEKFIETTINSVLAQTYSKFEIIVVDDESNDNTIGILKEYCERDGRVKLYSISHSARPSVPLNKGIDLASGELIAFLDHDDLWEKHKLEEQVNALGKNTNYVFAYSMSITYGDVSVFSPYYEVLPLLFRATRNREELIKKGNSITPSTVLAWKDKLREAGKFDEDPKLITHDYDMWLRLSVLGDFKFIPRIHCFYHVHTNQLSRGWEIKRDRLEYLRQKSGLELPEYNFYRNRGIFFLIPRNVIHFSTYLFIKLFTFIDRKFLKLYA